MKNRGNGGSRRKGLCESRARREVVLDGVAQSPSGQVDLRTASIEQFDPFFGRFLVRLSRGGRRQLFVGKQLQTENHVAARRRPVALLHLDRQAIGANGQMLDSNLVLTKRKSKRAIWEEYKVHGRTLEKTLAHEEPPGYRLSNPDPSPKLGQFVPIIHEILKQDQQAPKKQRHTAKRIFERLRDEYGYEGKLTIVKDAVRAWKLVRHSTL